MMDDARAKVRKAVTEALRRARKPQAVAAVEAGISPSTVSLAVRAGIVTVRTAERLAPVLGVAPEELLP